jgi:hypothetical protein
MGHGRSEQMNDYLFIKVDDFSIILLYALL